MHRQDSALQILMGLNGAERKTTSQSSKPNGTNNDRPKGRPFSGSDAFNRIVLLQLPLETKALFSYLSFIYKDYRIANQSMGTTAKSTKVRRGRPKMPAPLEFGEPVFSAAQSLLVYSLNGFGGWTPQ